MAFVRILTTLLRDKELGQRVVPIVPDESRTFGMEGLFRQVGIFSQVGQLYRPQDADQLMYYREDPKGQILQEGINEPGAMASFIAAGDVLLDVERGDDPVLHLLLDVRLPAGRRSGLGGGRSCAPAASCIGGTSGRTTLNGEGLQHEDGHSHLLPPPSRTASPTIRPTLTRSPSSSRPASSACMSIRTTSSITSPR